MATNTSDTKRRKVLVIGGFDPSGGAGLQIDLATLAQIGVFAYSAVSAITIQDSLSVKEVYPVSASILKEQIETVLNDSVVGAVKMGMLASAENVEVVADLLERNKFEAIVLDPVIKASRGADLFPLEDLPVLIKRLVPLVTVITPNLLEAEAISGHSISSVKKIKEAAKVIYRRGAAWVLIKGGHLSGDKCIDILYNGKQFFEFSQPKLKGSDVRGTGCMLASALAGYLIQGYTAVEATDLARKFVLKKIKHAKKLGKGRPQAV